MAFGAVHNIPRRQIREFGGDILCFDSLTEDELIDVHLIILNLYIV